MAMPFTLGIIDTPLLRDFRLPSIKAYIGTSNPWVHMMRYKAKMVMIGVDDTVMFMAFLSTLDGTAHEWFDMLPDRSI